MIGMGISSLPSLVYHAGENLKNREKVLNDFLSGRVDIAVATIAFGMGIDRASVRFVVHYTVRLHFVLISFLFSFWV